MGIKVDDLETNHFVLVHGGGFGAWCWYKTIALLEESGYKVSAIDLTGSGVHSFDTNNITSLSQYVTPLTDFLEKLPEGKKVILVGHDFGGACISYAMELFPLKISKAVFIAAAMPTNGQSTLDIISQQAGSNDLMPKAQNFLYANGNDRPPTAFDLDKSLLRDLLFNQSPTK
ncbi:methylesterase chloroplastic-like, partial [Trifolium pratense]